MKERPSHSKVKLVKPEGSGIVCLKDGKIDKKEAEEVFTCCNS